VSALAANTVSAILASLWVGGCLALAAALLTRLLPSEAAAWRYRIWLGALWLTLAGLLIPGLTSYWNQRTTYSQSVVSTRTDPVATGGVNPFSPPVLYPAAELSQPETRSEEIPAPVGPVETAPAAVHLRLSPALAAPLLLILLLGAGLTLLRLLLQLRALDRLKRRAVLPPRHLLRLWTEALERLPPGRGLRLLVSPEIRLPAACGYFRPAILVPTPLTDSLTEEETRHLLLHEVAHLVRRDDWGLLVERVIAGFCWWHPAVWWITRRLDQEREQACDRLATLSLDQRGYARTLVRLAELVTSAPHALAPGALRGQLTLRIEALLATPTAPFSAARLIRGAPVGVLALAVLAAAFRFTPPSVGVTQPERAVIAPQETRLITPTGIAAGKAGLALDSLFTGYADSGFSGTILLARRGEILLQKGYGLADRERGILATGETRYSTAGFTKLFTATALLQLASEGRLAVDDSVTRFIGPLPGSKAGVTLRDLLTYRDGLTRLNAPVQRDQPEDFITALASTPASFTPGSAYRYNDHGHSLLGVVIERVTGEEYESYIRTHYLKPADLAQTGFEDEGGPVATEYSGPADRLQPVSPRAYRWGRRASLGLVSTAGDLYRWFQALSDPRVVPASVRNELFQVRGRTDYGSEQGFGLELINRGQGHRLWRRVAGTPGMEGEILHDPDQDWTAVILVNTRLGWRFRVWREIERLMWQAPS